MNDKINTKLSLEQDCKNAFMLMVRELTLTHYKKDGTCISGMTQTQLAFHCHLTISQMSRVATGVCCPSAPVFYAIQRLYKSQMSSKYDSL